MWYVASSDIPGLFLEAATPQDLIARVSEAAPEMIGLNRAAILAAHGRSRQGRTPSISAADLRQSDGCGICLIVPGYTPELEKRLIAGGCEFFRNGKGDHEIWSCPNGSKASSMATSSRGVRPMPF